MVILSPVGKLHLRGAKGPAVIDRPEVCNAKDRPVQPVVQPVAAAQQIGAEESDQTRIGFRSQLADGHTPRAESPRPGRDFEVVGEGNAAVTTE